MDAFHLAERPCVAEAIEAAAKCNTMEEVQAAINAYAGTDLARDKQAPLPSIADIGPGGLAIITEKAEPEDLETGKPFSGSYGGIMLEVLERTGIDMSKVHVLYAVNWAPNGEKSVNATQISVSRPFLFRQLEILKPRAMLMPGRAVYESLIGRRDPITPLLGLDFTFEWNELKLPSRLVWHPAFALRFRTQIGDYAIQVQDFVNQHALPEDMLPEHRHRLQQAA